MTPIALAAAGWTVRENPGKLTAERGIHFIEAEQTDGGLWTAWFFVDSVVKAYTHNWNDRAAALDTLSERAWGGTTVGAFCGVCP